MANDPKPVYLIAGGPSSKRGHGPDPLLQEALQLAAVKSPTLAYIGAASGDNVLFRRMMARLLCEAGAGDVKLVPLCGSRSDAQKARSIIESCHIVFLSGGDVEAGMRVLEKHGLKDFLRSQYRKGKPFFGISAGSIMLAKSWVRWKDPDIESSAEVYPCLNMANIYCDTHGEDNGWDELLTLTCLIPDGSMGYGIPLGAALIAYPDASIRALGGEVHRFIRKDGIAQQIQSLFPIPDSLPPTANL
jgi:cyanophycinase-like exopeptidase